MKVAHDFKTWFRAALLYTVAGCLASGLTGMLLGALGAQLGRAVAARSALAVGLLVTLALAARELGWIRFPLPERKRQTEKFWFDEFGPLGAAWLWGLHLGVGFATRVNFGGLWALAVLAVGIADPLFGALLLASYWLGRTLPVWLAPRLWNAEVDGPSAMAAMLFTDRTPYRRIQGLALLFTATMLAWWLFAAHGPAGLG